jgi:hypothetical protein
MKSRKGTERNIRDLLYKAHKKDQQALASKNSRKRRELLERSLSLARKALRYRENAEAYRQIARVFLHRRALKQSLAKYKSGLQIVKMKEKHLFYNGIGNVYRCMADFQRESRILYKDSVDIYKKAISLAPKEIRGLYYSNLAASYAGLREWDSAIRAGKKALNLLQQEEERHGIDHGNQLKLLKLEVDLWREYKKRNL